MVINQANLNIGIDSDRLYTEKFQSPVTGKSYVPESGRNMDEQAQTPGGGTSLQRDITAGAGIFICPSQIYLFGSSKGPSSGIMIRETGFGSFMSERDYHKPKFSSE